MCNARHADFGVTHRGCIVAVHRTEVALAVYQHVTQGKILCHTHYGVVDRRITVRVVFTDDVTDDTRRFFVGPVPVITELVHGKQHTPMHGFQAVAHIWQCAPHNHAHGV